MPKYTEVVTRSKDVYRVCAALGSLGILLYCLRGLLIDIRTPIALHLFKVSTKYVSPSLSLSRFQPAKAKTLTTSHLLTVVFWVFKILIRLYEHPDIGLLALRLSFLLAHRTTPYGSSPLLTCMSRLIPLNPPCLVPQALRYCSLSGNIYVEGGGISTVPGLAP